MSAVALDRLGSLRPVSLDELNAAASLMTRRDRKYVVTADQLSALVDGLLHAVADGRDDRLDALGVLAVDGRTSFRYESVYHDTAGFDAYLAAARRRPQRFKVRTRRYADTGGCWIEVKLRDRTGRTVKHRAALAATVTEPAPLGAQAAAFVAGVPAVRGVLDDLRPVLTTRYRRATLLVGADRVTLDADLACEAAGGRGGAVGIGEAVVVETKSAGPPGVTDRLLWSVGARPVAISKFAIGIAAAHPSLPANRWHRLLVRHVRPC